MLKVLIHFYLLLFLLTAFFSSNLKQQVEIKFDLINVLLHFPNFDSSKNSKLKLNFNFLILLSFNNKVENLKY
jgi:hypothetical protein